MPKKTFLEYEGELKEATVFEVNSNLITYCLPGEPTVETLFIRSYENDNGERVYVMTEKGFNEGTLVTLKYTEKALDRLLKKAAPAEKEFLLFILGGRQWLSQVRDRTLVIKSANKTEIPCPSRHKEGEEASIEIYSFSIPDYPFTINIPTEWLCPLSKEKEERYRLKETITGILKKRKEKLDHDKADIIHKISEAETVVLRQRALLKAHESRTIEGYVEKELNGLSRSETLLQSDARVASMSKAGENVTVRTKFLIAKAQNRIGEDHRGRFYNFTLANGEQLTIPIGELEIVFQQGQNPYFYCKSPKFTGLERYHPHNLGGGKLCYGDYGTAYSDALANKDYYTCFQIAVEVLTNFNPNSATHHTYQMVDAVLGSNGIKTEYFSKLEEAVDNGEEVTDFDIEKVQEQLTSIINQNQKELPLPNSKIRPAKLYDKKLIAEIISELNP